MQKARRHPQKGLRPLVGARVQGLFQPPRGVLFTFPSRYLFAIGLTGVFSLAGWARRVRAGLHVPRATQGTAGRRKGLRVLGCHHLWPDFPDRSARPSGRRMAALLPPTRVATGRVWAGPRSLAATGGITVVFSSCGY